MYFWDSYGIFVFVWYFWDFSDFHRTFRDSLSEKSAFFPLLFSVLSIHLFVFVSWVHSVNLSTVPLSLFHSPSLGLQDTTAEGVLSSCGCSLTLTLTTSIDIWRSAGATRSWLHSPGRSKSFALAGEVSPQPKFSIWMLREALRDSSQIRIGDTKKQILMSEIVCCGYP